MREQPRCEEVVDYHREGVEVSVYNRQGEDVVGPEAVGVEDVGLREDVGWGAGDHCDCGRGGEGGGRGKVGEDVEGGVGCADDGDGGCGWGEGGWVFVGGGVDGEAFVQGGVGEGGGVRLLGGDSGGLDEVFGGDDGGGRGGAGGEGYFPELGGGAVGRGVDFDGGEEVEVECGDESSELIGESVSGKTVRCLHFFRVGYRVLVTFNVRLSNSI